MAKGKKAVSRKRDPKITTIGIFKADKKILDGRPRAAGTTNAHIFHELLIAAKWTRS